MKIDYVAVQSIVIRAPIKKVWDALINPEMIKQYLFGTEVVTEWKIGGPIRYRGVWKDKPYEDKGTILDLVQEKRIVSTFWSSLGGLPDTPENYKKVTYELAAEGSGTRLTISQDNNATEEEKNHSEQNWKVVLEALKKLAEG